MPRSFLLIVLLLAHALAVAAAPQQLKPGTYYLGGDSGTLKIQADGTRGLRFSIWSLGANGHMCDVEGTLRGLTGTADDGAGSVCTVFFRRVGTAIEVEPRSMATCHMFCGVRASIDGTYRTVTQACVPESRQARRAQSLKSYQARRYEAAVLAWQALLAQCRDEMGEVEADGVRNDLALAQYRKGDPAACLETLDDTHAGAVDSEEALKNSDPMFAMPSDFDRYLPLAKAIWFNRAMCRKAIRPPR